MDKIDSSAGSEWLAPDGAASGYWVKRDPETGDISITRVGVGQDPRDPMRNTLAGSLTELRAAWLAIIDPLMQLLTRWLDAVMELVERVRKG